MILFPIEVIHIKEPDLLIFADHQYRDCATAYRLRENHSDRQVLQILRNCTVTREHFIDAFHDLQAYITYIGSDPLLSEEARANKKGVYSAVSMMLQDCVDQKLLLQGGVEVDPITLEPTYWLLVRGFVQDARYELVPLHKAWEAGQ